MLATLKKNLFFLTISVLLLLSLAVDGVTFQSPAIDISTTPVGGEDKVATTKSPQVATKSLRVHYLDVGQGDSIYIRTPDNQDILIDGGPDKNVLAKLGEVMPFYDRDIDVVILTHAHADHVAGLVEVLRRYKVGQIYYTGALHNADDYLAFLKEIKDQNIPLAIVKEPFDLQLGENDKLEFLYPLEDFTNRKVADLNSTSIVTRLVYGNTNFLFTGDAPLEAERDILDHNINVQADVLKIGHHGSYGSTGEEFLKAVSPSYAVISVGLDNSFGHPSLRTVRLLDRLGIPYFRTDEQGTIELESDGVMVWQGRR